MISNPRSGYIFIQCRKLARIQHTELKSDYGRYGATMAPVGKAVMTVMKLDMERRERPLMP